ncbi:MAG: hypothetical protein H0U72_03815 [Nitrosospira sp.]|nr:hypothetical protein [Nitrosospira sp.]
MEDNVSTGEESENPLIIVLQAFEYHKLERFPQGRVSGWQKNRGLEPQAPSIGLPVSHRVKSEVG